MKTSHNLFSFYGLKYGTCIGQNLTHIRMMTCVQVSSASSEESTTLKVHLGASLYPEDIPDPELHVATPNTLSVTPRSGEYGDVTATYIRRSEIPSRIYAKHQYRKESEYGSTWCIIHSNT